MTPNGSGAVVELKDVIKQYTLGDGSTLTAADAITTTIAAGAITAITGPSGSGKSTLLHLIGAIDSPDSGTITVDGHEITRMNRNQLADYRASIGFIFQQFHLLPALTLLDNVLAPLVGRKVTFDAHERSRELLAAVGLEDRFDALPSQLSGGQQQRVAIARALIAQPRLLLADEPTGNLDSHTAAEIIALIHRLQSDRGATVVIATHDASVASQATHTLHVSDGSVAVPV
ncbi:MAG: ABC transporter ATP-binding protein [Dermatophilaceae bacterium]